MSPLRPPDFAQALSSRAPRAPVVVIWGVPPLGPPLTLAQGLGGVSFHHSPASSVPARPGCSMHTVCHALPHVAAPSQPARPPQAAVPSSGCLLLEKTHAASRNPLEKRVAAVPAAMSSPCVLSKEGCHQRRCLRALEMAPALQK